jgi:ferritin-like metal-binding protein YciE
LLAASLQEEKEADMRLSDIAMEDINEEAAEETA